MPRIMLNGAAIYYEEHGNGDETIVFAHGLLWSGQMYEAQVASLKDRYRCITFDFRGQGQSEATATGYDMDTLAQDALALIKERVGKPVHFVGLSMGGFVGMRLAIHHPEWLLSLSLLETSADPEPKENLLKYKLLPKVARMFGMWIVAPQAMKIMFGKTFLNDPARKSQRAEMRRRLLQNDKINIGKAIEGVFSRQGVYEYLPSIKTPTLIVVGDEDIATIPAKSRRMNTAIQGSQLVVIPHAGHTSTIETPDAVTNAIREFLHSLAL